MKRKAAVEGNVNIVVAHHVVVKANKTLVAVHHTHVKLHAAAQIIVADLDY